MKKALFILSLIYLHLFNGYFTYNANSQILNDVKKNKTEWAKVDSLDKLALPESALKLVEDIYKIAKKDNNHDQIIKAFIYRMKYINATKENSFENLIQDTKVEISNSDFPNNAVLNSMLAEMYWMYYTNNRYNFYERTNTIDYNSDDIKTWTLDQLIDKVIKHYLISLSEKEKLQNTLTNSYDEIIQFGSNSRELRPSLYEFLAWRALDFFKTSELSLSKPADYFQLKEDFYFSDAESFSKIKINTKDTLSLHFYAILIYKEILNFRLNDKNLPALINSDLSRIEFVNRFSVNANKDTLYLNYLRKLQFKYADKEEFAEISYYIADYYNKNSIKYNPEIENTKIFKNFKQIAYNLCENAIDKFPKSYGASMCMNLKYNILNANLSFKTEKVLSVGQNFSSLISYRNIDTVFIKVGKIDRELLSKLKDKYYGKELYDKIKSSVKAIKSYTEILPESNDFNAHKTEFVFDKLDFGTYIIFIANNEKFEYDKNITTYSEINISNIAYFKRKLQNGSFEFHVMDRTKGTPLNNVTVKAYYQKYNYTLRKYRKILNGTYTTNEQGYFIVDAVKGQDSKYLSFEFINGADYYDSESSAYLYFSEYNPQKSKKVFLYTDRAIYRPGQTIYFKGIMINTDGENNEIVANQKVNVILYDVNYKKIADQNYTTNEFGSFNGTFSIPQGLLNGQMQIYCSGYGYKYVSVEEYKRPKFEVEILPFEGNYLLNDTVSIKGKAKAFAGSMISDAKVKYRISRTPIWHGWWYYSIPSIEIQIADGELITDEKGEYEIDFVALPDLSINKSEHVLFNYKIDIDVTDLNGETHSVSKNMLVGYTSLKLSLDIPNDVNKDDIIDKFKINTSNVNGEFITAKGEINVYKLQKLNSALRERMWEKPDQYLYSNQEWEKLFAGNVFDDENNIQKRKIEKLVFNSKFDTEKSKEIEFSKINKWESGLYYAETKSVDAFGNSVSWKNYFVVFSEKDKQTADKIIDYFIPLKTNAEPGENAEFLIGSAEKNIKVLYEIEHKNKIIEKKWLQLNDNQHVIEIPVKEEYRGNFAVHFNYILNNRYYKHTETIIVPYSNKRLDIVFETFRDKLYPGQNEEWKMKISGKNGEKVAAEFLTTLYDASLDMFKANYWDFNIYRSYYSSLAWNSDAFNTLASQLYSINFNKNFYFPYRAFDQFNWFGFSYYYYNDRYFSFGGVETEEEAPMLEKVTRKESKKNGNKRTALPVSDMKANGDEFDDSLPGEPTVEAIEDNDKELQTGENFENVHIRTNFNETAFFYPELQTNSEGELIVKFTIPESLTKWKMMGFAHTKDLKYGFVNNQLVTQKDLMILPNEPRFFRQSDKIIFPAKLSNLTDEKMNGVVRLELFDAITMEPIEGIFSKKESAEKSFDVDGKRNILIEWELNIPENIGAVTYKIVAKADKFSDGEQKAIPVLSNRMLVTESLPLPIRGKQTKEFELTKLVKSKKSESLKNFKLTLEFTSNPAWYALQALPYIMEYPYECSEQTFSRFYANSIASHVVNSSPKIKRVFDSWKDTPDSKAFLSNLEKNQELKSVLLEETPWVLDAVDEQVRKKRIGLLFDLNTMADQLNRAKTKLEKAQKSNGAWPWFDGMPESRYITQYIVEGFGHLDHLGIENIRKDEKIWKMITDAVNYLDIRLKEDYDWLKKNYKKDELEKNHLSNIAIHYLYGRSYFKDIPVPEKSQNAFDYYKNQSEKYWTSQDLYSKGLIALFLNRYNSSKVAGDIVKSLKEYSLDNEELGMYWKNNVAGYYWYTAPIETQALMIEVFDEVAQNQVDVEALKVWLLKQKQTQDWKTTKATTEAVYALLLKGVKLLDSDKMVNIQLGDLKIEPDKMDGVQIEAGTGYFKTSWSGSDIKPEMGKVKVKKEDEGVAWGSLYWQYFEDLDKITIHETPLKLDKKLFVERITERGKIIEPISKKTNFILGDKVIVRIELRVDRDMEYVHMKDMRASGFEPINVFSTYKYQGGLGYYESTKDAATNFFMAYLPKGTYVFEYPLRVTHKGDFSNGITTIQCMYAPEFTSHSEGVRVKVE
ncbi:MAG: hypothetical protein JXR51_02680 [Bacteroidales bacterium]|nr:hypothetical protein [Bacteroidales bacterium]